MKFGVVEMTILSSFCFGECGFIFKVFLGYYHYYYYVRLCKITRGKSIIVFIRYGRFLVFLCASWVFCISCIPKQEYFKNPFVNCLNNYQLSSARFLSPPLGFFHFFFSQKSNVISLV